MSKHSQKIGMNVKNIIYKYGFFLINENLENHHGTEGAFYFSLPSRWITVNGQPYLKLQLLCFDLGQPLMATFLKF